MPARLATEAVALQFLFPEVRPLVGFLRWKGVANVPSDCQVAAANAITAQARDW